MVAFSIYLNRRVFVMRSARNNMTEPLHMEADLMTCANSVDIDQSAHPYILISAYAGC